MSSDRSSVPCNGCTACCKGTHVLVHRVLGDEESNYETEVHESGLRVLKKVNNQCVYLGATGCTIWDRAPALCREFDCRRAAALGLPIKQEVYEIGCRLNAQAASAQNNSPTIIARESATRS